MSSPAQSANQPAGSTAAASPPAPGEYRYRTRSTHQGYDFYGLLRVGPLREVDGQRRQVHQPDDGDHGSDVHSVEYVWRADGVFVGVVDNRFTGPSTPCDYQPDALLYRLPLSVGDTWSVDSSCTYRNSMDGESHENRLRATSKVVRPDRVAVAGQDVDVYVIESRSQIAIDGWREVVLETTDYFAPGVGLSVRQSTNRREVLNGRVVEEEDREVELTTLKP